LKKKNPDEKKSNYGRSGFYLQSPIQNVKKGAFEGILQAF
jgi:hypothetical protein